MKARNSFFSHRIDAWDKIAKATGLGGNNIRPVQTMYIENEMTPFNILSAVANAEKESLIITPFDVFQKWTSTKPEGNKSKDPSNTNNINNNNNAIQAQTDIIVAEIHTDPSKKDSGILWDIYRPLLPEHNNCRIVFHNFSSFHGKSVLWHSTSHLLGQALESHFGEKINLADGPSLVPNGMKKNSSVVPAGADGFFYEFLLKDKGTVKLEELSSLTKHMQQYIKKKQKFERMDLTVEQAFELFQENPLKLEIINKYKGKESKDKKIFSAYRCGNFIDLCRGPHIPNAGIIGAFALTKCNASANDQQRVYGISFSKKSDMDDWKIRTEQAKQRDHRVIGKNQKIFFFDDHSPGSAMILPHGSIILNKLIALLRDEYSARGFQEVWTPQIYSNELWKTSGHYQAYRENMYEVTAPKKASDEKQLNDHHDHDHGVQYGLKPMNCPGHCLIYAHEHRSFRQLPIRLADFSSLHRNELAGALGGLTRLRRFHQDDAHVFCREDQIGDEIASCLEFIKKIYQDHFGFEYNLYFSTRPEQSIGSDESWHNAENKLRKCLIDSGQNWTEDKGEGAFYGPKIDVTVLDSLGRQHQCATIQLDFQLPERFNLTYADSTSNDKEKSEIRRPVMIHRAVLGSLERFLAILMEHTGGQWQFWLSPRQCMVIPVVVTDQELVKYAHSIAQDLRHYLPQSLHQHSKDDHQCKNHFMESNSALGMIVDVDDSTLPFAKRIRNSMQQQYNMIVIVGTNEQKQLSVSVRTKKMESTKSIPIEQFKKACATSIINRANEQIPSGLLPYLSEIKAPADKKEQKEEDKN